MPKAQSRAGNNLFKAGLCGSEWPYYNVAAERTAVALNIKNEATHRLARKLARATGESITVAVTEAIRERQELVPGRSPSRYSTVTDFARFLG